MGFKETVWKKVGEKRAGGQERPRSPQETQKRTGAVECHGWGFTDEDVTKVLSSSQSFASITRQLDPLISLRKAKVPCCGQGWYLGCPQGLPSSNRSVQASGGPCRSCPTPSPLFQGYARGYYKRLFGGNRRKNNFHQKIISYTAYEKIHVPQSGDQRNGE